jgi:hypothetical protein
MSADKERDARNEIASTPKPAVEGESGQYVSGDYGDARATDAAAGPRGAGEYAEGDYGDAGAVDTGTGPRRAGEYAEGDYGQGGATDTATGARGAGGYAEGDYGDAGTAHGSGVPQSRPKDLPEDEDAVRDPTDNDTEG